MNTPVRVILQAVGSGVVAFLITSCGQAPTVQTNIRTIACVPAPPGPTDLGPATGLSDPPSEAVVFNLRYRAQTGTAEDIPYHSYWGYGGAIEETKTDPFLREVRQQASDLHYDKNYAFKGRAWSAIEHKDRQAVALFFDLNGDGKLDKDERIAPTRQENNAIQFITPDFINVREDGSKNLCRALLQVEFYDGNSEPNCMWSPAAVMEGTAKLDGQPARLMLFANQPGGAFGKHGECSYALLGGADAEKLPEYLPRETLSSLICNNGKFYHLKIEGAYANGLPARVVLTKDPSPTGNLAVKLSGSAPLQACINSVYLRGTDDPTVYFHSSATKKEMCLPEGQYALTSGVMTYGASGDSEWELWFRDGPQAQIKEGQCLALTLGQPALKVRAIDETQRYNLQAKESATFKKGTKIYLEPRILGKNQEVFSRFREGTDNRNGRSDRPPKITITAANGKQVLASTMEYG